MIRKRHFSKIVLSVLLLMSATVQAQVISTGQEVSKDLKSSLPTDPNVKVGKLENGLTYYIRKNSKPENKAELRLVVNAGSILENEDQQGLAHFVEHMAFNGTKNFKKNELVSYLQSIGVKFGADLNAYTSFDETVYILPVPTEKDETVAQAFNILEDWAHNVTFEGEEIDKERGIVIEEWRRGRGADQRMRDQYFPILFKGSRYAERLPIGTKEILENFEHETLKQFYKDWYRPDLMAVVAVGDFDPATIEKQIKEHFAGIPKPNSPRKRETYDVPGHKETLVAIATDKEATFNQIQLIYKHGEEETDNIGDFRRDAVYSLYNGMINQRLQELTQSPEPPFVFANTSYSGFIGSVNAYSAFAVVGPNGIEKGLSTLIQENNRVLKYGFTQSELDRYKQQMLASYERSFNEQEKTESRVYASEYIRNFLDNEPIPGISFEYKFMQEYLPSITLEEVNALAKKFITNENRVVILTGPEKEGMEMPSEDEVLSIVEKAENEAVTAYEDGLSATAIMEERPAPAKVVSSTEKPQGVTELVLENGVTVVLKPTEFKNDEILMTAFSPGGSSLYSDADYQSASNADGIVAESGVAELSAVDIGKLLTGKNVSVSPSIGSYSEGFSGSATPKDLETMLQLLHQYFTNPRKDAKAFQSYITKNKQLYGNLLANPQYYFINKQQEIIYQGHPRAGGFPSAEDWERVDFEKAFEIYQERFADASDFTFVFVGNFDVEEMTEMLRAYLGNLPKTDRKESWKDTNMRYASGMVEEKVYKGTDPKSQVTMAFAGYFDYDRELAYKMRSISEALNIKLIENIREKESGVYSIGASFSASRTPVGSYRLNISFPCAPENAERLSKLALDELKKIQKEGVTEEDLEKIKEAQRQDMKVKVKENRYWLSTLRSAYTYGYDIDDLLNYEEKIESLSAKELKKVAKKYFDTDEFIKIMLMPETEQGK